MNIYIPDEYKKHIEALTARMEKFASWDCNFSDTPYKFLSTDQEGIWLDDCCEQLGTIVRIALDHVIEDIEKGPIDD